MKIFETNTNYTDINQVPKFDLSFFSWEKDVRNYALKFDDLTRIKLGNLIQDTYMQSYLTLELRKITFCRDYYIKGQNDTHIWELEAAYSHNRECGIYFATLTDKLSGESTRTILYGWRKQEDKLNPNSPLNYDNIDKILSGFTNEKQRVELKLLFLESLNRKLVSNSEVKTHITKVKQEMKMLTESNQKETQ